jgi:hypothetical protein
MTTNREFAQAISDRLILEIQKLQAMLPQAHDCAVKVQMRFIEKLTDRLDTQLAMDRMGLVAEPAVLHKHHSDGSVELIFQ